ncbi:MAG TPA: DNA translocase FtsK 4TM domain-containing protein [Stellaceae bacterium]|jgi:S-DNA-T family DNA segregation ATPase FtsK/SpoIIIE|nr:DNA translocase FtsK 4TM domain-containing protein [Stellaceae bacterium]
MAISESIKGQKPSPLMEALRRRLTEGAGVLLVFASLLLAVTLASFDRNDPSPSHAIDGPVRNIAGPMGAVVADVLLQAVGLAAALLPAVLLAWAFRLLLNRGVTQLTLRSALLLPLLVLGAIALNLIPPGLHWPIPAGLGGIVGLMGLDVLAHTGAPRPALAMAAAALAGLLLLYVLGLTLEDWALIGRGASRAARVSGRGGLVLGRLGLWLRARLFRASERPAAARTPRREPALGNSGESAAEDPLVDEEALEVPPRPRAAADVVPAKKVPSERRRQRQTALDLGPGGQHVLPPIDLLTEPPPAARSTVVNEDALQQNARMLETVLEDFGVRGQIVKVRPGPVVTLYELEPAPGIKASRIIGLADDIARSMSAVSVRVAVVPGRSVIGIELPNTKAEMVYLREILSSDAYDRSGAQLALALGKDIGGTAVIADLARMPHLLIAGTTGSGKSVGINTMILSMLYRLPPDRCKFIMIDPKMLELSVYDGIPHLLAPVVTDPRKAVVALKWTVKEMENRYRAMSKLGVRNVEGYNARLKEAQAKGESLMRRVQTGFDPETGQPVFEEQPLDMTPLPLIIVVVDEMADLMLVAGKDIEVAVQRLAQMARAAGIHLVMATQRPSVDVITGTIKANFPTRISFQVTSKIDSRTILGESGAEQLLGRGDMLFMAGGGRITRVHGPFVSDEEVEAVVRFLKDRGGEPVYVEDVTEDPDEAPAAFEGEEAGGSGDQLYDQAVALVCRERKASTSFIQRHLQIGYNRAARIVERMEQEGVVSTANHVGKREVLARSIE